MRYLVTWMFKPVPPTMAKVALKLNEATEVWIEAEQKAGTMVETWATSDAKGGVAIVEHKSNDDVYKKIMEVPYYPFMDFSVTPLTDMKLSMRVAREFLQKMAGM